MSEIVDDEDVIRHETCIVKDKWADRNINVNYVHLLYQYKKMNVEEEAGRLMSLLKSN